MPALSGRYYLLLPTGSSHPKSRGTLPVGLKFAYLYADGNDCRSHARSGLNRQGIFTG